MTRWARRRFGWTMVSVLAVALLPCPAHARVDRYAVIVGNNAGTAGEARLRYAEDDARKIHDVLRKLGDFRSEEMALLLDDNSESFERALIEINARLRAKKTASSQTLLLVYYSGHADALALHMGSSRFELERLRSLVRGSAADFRILLLDACRSGALTRVKGARPAVPFTIEIDPALAGEGVAYLTSSSANEDAQESDELKGSFFTHYFVSGLRGAADRNGDGAVSVEEVYSYAYQHTLRASSQTLYGLQHPTFSFDMRGRGGIALTFPSRRSSPQARLEFPPGRTYVLFADGPGGAVVAEVNQYDTRRRLTVEPGRYFVRGRASDHLLEGMLDVSAGKSTAIDDKALDRVQYARLVRKGLLQGPVSHGPWLAYQLRMPLWDRASPCQGARLGYAVDTPWLTATPQAGFCHSRYSNDVLSVDADELDLEVAVARVFDLPVVSLGVGFALGGAWLRQSFETRRLAPTRHTAAGHGDVLVDIMWDLPGGVYLIAELAGQLYVFREREASDAPVRMTAIPTARAVLGVGTRFSM